MYLSNIHNFFSHIHMGLLHTNTLIYSHTKIRFTDFRFFKTCNQLTAYALDFISSVLSALNCRSTVWTIQVWHPPHHHNSPYFTTIIRLMSPSSPPQFNPCHYFFSPHLNWFTTMSPNSIQQFNQYHLIYQHNPTMSPHLPAQFNPHRIIHHHNPINVIQFTITIQTMSPKFDRWHWLNTSSSMERVPIILAHKLISYWLHQLIQTVLIWPCPFPELHTGQGFERGSAVGHQGVTVSSAAVLQWFQPSGQERHPWQEAPRSRSVPVL